MLESDPGADNGYCSGDQNDPRDVDRANGANGSGRWRRSAAGRGAQLPNSAFHIPAPVSAFPWPPQPILPWQARFVDPGPGRYADLRVGRYAAERPSVHYVPVPGAYGGHWLVRHNPPAWGGYPRLGPGIPVPFAVYGHVRYGWQCLRGQLPPAPGGHAMACLHVPAVPGPIPYTRPVLAGWAMPGTSRCRPPVPGLSEQARALPAVPRNRLLRYVLWMPFPSPLEADIARHYLAQCVQHSHEAVRKEFLVNSNIITIVLTSEDANQLYDCNLACRHHLSQLLWNMLYLGPPISH